MSVRLHELQDVLGGRGGVHRAAEDPLVRRLVGILPDAAERVGNASPADLAGLIRQAILRVPEADPQTRQLLIPVRQGWPDRAMWKRFSCDVLTVGEGKLRIQPRAWGPEWLDPGAAEVVKAGVEETQRRHESRVPGDPVLSQYMHWSSYSSGGQRAAVQAAFLSSAGSTTIICLPTGGGKSLAFQLPAMVWQAEGGLTLVVTPTVALARDQEARFQALLASANGLGAGATFPLAFHSGLDAAARRLLIQGMRSGTTPIVFASPEAAIGALRDPLFDAARQGRLRLFVLDEAHLVAQWGEEFRPEFQSIAGLRDALLEACPLSARFRTLLLSATLTPETVETLRFVFGGGESELVGEVALRREIGFLINSAVDEATRTARVLEAVDHLPRPLILYTTLREHAADWLLRLRARGYRRLRLIRGGDLAGEESGRVLEDWRTGQVDIVVATSAFGVGMDQANVRSVIHACLPETIDRYYQEVGRAGRDGRAAVSLLVTAPEDVGVAQDLARKRRISVDRGFERWQSMWWGRNQLASGTYVLRLDASPADISSPGLRNEAWNLRTLVLMARAGLIAFDSHEPPRVVREAGEDDEQFQARSRQAFDRFYKEIAVRVFDLEHLDIAHWHTKVAPIRSTLYGQDARAMQLVSELLDLRRPLNEIFAEVYTLPSPPVAAPRLSGSCPVTRSRKTAGFVAAEPEVLSLSRTSIAVSADLTRILWPCTDPAGRSWVAYSPPAVEGLELRQWRQSVTMMLRQLASRGVVELFVPEALLESRDWTQIVGAAPSRFIVRATVGMDRDESMQLPRISLLDRATTSYRVLDEIMRLRRPQHIIVLPADTPDPARQGGLFLARLHHWAFEELKAKLQR